MTNIYNLYLDDSGTMHPDKKIGRTPTHSYDWFGFGGVLVRNSDEKDIKAKHHDFCTRWSIENPLHSSEIRAKADKFSFIGLLSDDKQNQFYEDLYQLMARISVIGFACVIDRPSYNKRYRELYGREKWSLCKTAFPIVVERAAKYSISKNGKLRVFIEKSDKKTEGRIRSYYDELKTIGTPFSQKSSSTYNPLNSSDFNSTLYEFRVKGKSSPIMQLADLYLWPMCMGGYNSKNRPYERLLNDGKLIDSLLSEEDVPHLGIKYSCWDLVQRR